MDSARIARALNVAALARLTLAGKRKGEGFWIMPFGADRVRLCWRVNMKIAREARTPPNEHTKEDH